MLRSTVVGVCPSIGRAEAAVREMLAAGIQPDDLSVMSPEEIQSGDLVDADHREPGGGTAGVGMVSGAALGGLGGLLASLGLLAIPGVGSVLAAGPIASAIAGAGIGAVGGALVGALVDLGVPDDEVEHFSEAVRRGAILLAARVDDDTIDRAVEIMERNGAMNVAELVERWRQGGWSRFDAAAAPYTTGELQSEREARRGQWHSSGHVPPFRWSVASRMPSTCPTRGGDRRAAQAPLSCAAASSSKAAASRARV